MNLAQEAALASRWRALHRHNSVNSCWSYARWRQASLGAGWRFNYTKLPVAIRRWKGLDAPVDGVAAR